jgi:DNA-binding transcriptional LysR family regulator
MELRHFRYFVAVAEELNFGRAANRLKISQPPLSRQIQDLEQELGTALFLREGKKVTLTKAGQRFLLRAKLVLSLASDAAREIRRLGRGQVGNLTVGYMSAAMLSQIPPILRKLRETVDVDVELVQLGPDAQLLALANGRIDVGFVDLVGREGVIHVSGQPLNIHAAWSEDLMLALPIDHAMGRSSSIDLSELSEEQFISLRPNTYSGFFDQVFLLCEKVGFRPHIRSIADTFPEIMALVASGFGISFAPRRSSHYWCNDVCFTKLTPETRTDVSIAYRAARRDELIEALVQVVDTTMSDAIPTAELSSRIV